MAKEPPTRKEFDALVLMVASLLDTLRRELIYGDREQAIEKFKAVDREFDKKFCGGD